MMNDRHEFLRLTIEKRIPTTSYCEHRQENCHLHCKSPVISTTTLTIALIDIGNHIDSLQKSDMSGRTAPHLATSFVLAVFIKQLNRENLKDHKLNIVSSQSD